MSTTPGPSLATTDGRVPGGAPEAEIANDVVRKGLLVAPLAVLVGALVGGTGGALSVLYGAALVLANLRISAAMLAWASKVSLGMVMGVALGGFVLRLSLVALAVWLVRDLWWVRPVPLGLTLVATHLGLLAWEAKFVSASLAFPGLKPAPVRTKEQAAK